MALQLRYLRLSQELIWGGLANTARGRNVGAGFLSLHQPVLCSTALNRPTEIDPYIAVRFTCREPISMRRALRLPDSAFLT